MKGLNLNRLRNTNFDSLYQKLVTGNSITEKECRKLLTLAIIFINEQDENMLKLGYRIIVLYCNQTKDYKPLYDIAINKGLYPIVKSIERMEKYNNEVEGSFFKLFQSSFGENYKFNGIYLSEQQNDLFSYFNESNEKAVSAIAPTSYGKSELIISAIKKRKSGNLCIIVPSKALIAQTKRRIIEANIKNIKKVITHPEMYIESDNNITAILTQERLLRLLRKDPNLKFDIVFIDEAHNLLELDERSMLLASSISIMEKRNSNVRFKFLTPFLIDSSNLSVKYTKYIAEPLKITEYIKTEKLYTYDSRKEKRLKLYDQFINKFYYTNDCDLGDDIALIVQKSSDKNIIYLNKPSDLERFSSKLSTKFTIINSNRIKNACKNISRMLDPNYSLINCIERGIIYHHGSVPDNIKMYIEHLYSDIKEMKYIVTTSTLLEGVNIPAYSLFLLDNKKGPRNLSSAQFKNLIGRICRFSEVFSPTEGSLKHLEPSVYLIGSNYVSSNANLEKFIKNVMKVDKKEKDTPVNVLLKNVAITSENKKQKEDADEFIENFEPGVITNYDKSYAQTLIGRLCFLNNVIEIDIIENEQQMQGLLDINGEPIASTQGIFNFFQEIFLPFIKQTENNLSRLAYPEARNFYKMFLDWRVKSASYQEMISNFMGYWDFLIEKGKDTDVYVGKWGDKTKNNGFRKLWTDIKTKTHKERVNLAIVRIKEEQDFLDNIFIKYIEVINDLKLIKKDLYEQIKYGTNDKSKITLIKNGLSLTLVNLLINDYQEYLNINNHLCTVVISPNILEKMVENNENEILIYEVKFNIRRH
ncbi:DEAD/DEAH box helicase [Shouchella clausii]|nr:DEAD/DEAH box helicase [Shouchella clausii]